ncbi:hypothetical protein ABPG72_007067 [Tetrahymena utriculariae]
MIQNIFSGRDESNSLIDLYEQRHTHEGKTTMEEVDELIDQCDSINANSKLRTKQQEILIINKIINLIIQYDLIDFDQYSFAKFSWLVPPLPFLSRSLKKKTAHHQNQLINKPKHFELLKIQEISQFTFKLNIITNNPNKQINKQTKQIKYRFKEEVLPKKFPIYQFTYMPQIKDL